MKYLDAVQKYFLAFCMLFTTGLVFTNVILRYFFQSAITWAEEVLRYCAVWITFVGASTCVKEDSHICIDILSGMLKPRSKKAFNIFLHTVGVAFGVVFLMISYRFVVQIQATQQVSATIGNVPMYLIYMCFPISFVLYIIRSVEGIVRNVKDLRTREEDEAV